MKCSAKCPTQQVHLQFIQFIRCCIPLQLRKQNEKKKHSQDADKLD